MFTYDKLLALIPVPLVLGVLAGWLDLVPLVLGLVVGSFLGGVLVFVSLFVVPPVPVWS